MVAVSAVAGSVVGFSGGEARAGAVLNESVRKVIREIKIVGGSQATQQG